MCIALGAVLLAWAGSFYTFQSSVSTGALMVAMAAREQIHSNLQFALLAGLDIGANMIAADFGGLINCSATSLEYQIGLAQYAAIQLHTFDTVRMLAVLAPIPGTSRTALVLVGSGQLGSIIISRSQVMIGDPTADTLTAFPLLAEGRIDSEHPELVLGAGLGAWIAEVSTARGWRASLAVGGWQWGDLRAGEGHMIQPLYQSVCMQVTVASEEG